MDARRMRLRSVHQVARWIPPVWTNPPPVDQYSHDPSSTSPIFSSAVALCESEEGDSHKDLLC